MLLLQTGVLYYFFKLNKTTKSQINECLEEFFITKNHLLKEKVISLMYYELLIHKLQIKYFTALKSTKLLMIDSNKIFQDIFEDLTKLSKILDLPTTTQKPKNLANFQSYTQPEIKS